MAPMSDRATAIWTAVRRDVLAFTAFMGDIEVRLRDGGVLMLTGGPSPDFNIAAFDADSGGELALAEFVGRVQELGVPGLFMLSSRCAARLAPIARHRGLIEAATMPLMVLDVEPPSAVADGFTVQRVTDVQGITHAADLIASAFSLDRAWTGRIMAAEPALESATMSFFVAYRDGTPWSTVTTTRAAKDVVGIWSMASDPTRQRQGAGRAVLVAAIMHNRRQGARRFYLIATAQGKPLYDALGFLTVDEFPIWISGPAEDAHH
jgi:N-acetylglutamate synthase-like GNAT family acetyltransferase